MVDALASALEPWAALYGDHPLLATAILGAHLLALFIGGGVAIAADRALLRADGEARGRVLEELEATHPLVIRMLAVAVATGVLMAAADVATFTTSWVYWTKMATFALLLLNGVAMRRAETAARGAMGALGHAPTGGAALVDGSGWPALRSAAVRSLGGWGALVLLGVLLTNG